MNHSVESTTPVYTLSTTSTLSGIPVHSIRQYVDRGLIIPFRKETNRNLFSQVDILRLKYIHKLLVEDGLNIAGIRSVLALIPCWSIRKCSAEEREKCQAYHSDSNPCWEASEKGKLCKNTNCRECEVYRIVENYPDVKSYLKTLSA
ncbi:MAG: MerR family transcriptional regulator [Bacteroidota bacterium]|nr:MerR family transcriptional regulator [Odoribacter sp.]MDP3642174.1 MerR family transcriptional regulator [Bacteroidota bacterium]